MTELGITTQTFLSATTPFDLRCTLRAIAGFQPGLRDVRLDEHGVRRAFTHPSDPSSAVVAGVTARDDGAPGVALTVHSAAPLTPPELDDVGARVSAWLGLTDDRAEFLRVAEADEPVRPLLAVAAGLHQVRFSSLAEGVAYFALVQNSAQWYASLHKRRLTIHLGPMAQAGGEDFVAFPDLSTLTGLTPEQFLPYVGGTARATRLAELIGGVAALDEGLLRHGPYEEARAALLAVRGVGAYTAHSLLLRVLGRPDAVPLEMEQFVRTAKGVYGDPPPAPDELRERYGRWVGWWAYTCRTALGWLDQEKKARERVERAGRLRQRPPASRRPRPSRGRARLGGAALAESSQASGLPLALTLPSRTGAPATSGAEAGRRTLALVGADGAAGHELAPAEGDAGPDAIARG
ncbi:hypothetical protein AB0M46_03145 [Dactylosporangium sp. NPDC051485]|uniref:hypothetical protein n=1 Tax=Dactylosporangium sp. NPDC051485 TaxID=3154846 RepID=UPI0034425AD4